MEVFDAVRARKSIRAYEPKEIPEDVMSRILESARISPSANNGQPWHFIVVRDADKRKILSGHRWTKFLTEAPVVIVGCGNKKKVPEWYMIDTTIALQTMVLTATSEGVGTCWIGDFDEEEVREVCKIPKDFSVVCLLAMGYPREKIELMKLISRARGRKSLDEIVSYEEFGKKK